MQYKTILKRYKIPIIIIICLIFNIIIILNYAVNFKNKKTEFKEIKPLINYSKKCNAPSFKAGISSRLFSKLRQDGADIVEIMKKTDDIYNINDKNFVLADAVYNAKEKTADFFLSAVDMIKFIPGLENVSPKVVMAKGEKLSDAFQNIKLNDLINVRL